MICYGLIQLNLYLQQEVDRASETTAPATAAVTPVGLQHVVEKLKHRATLAIRELHQAQQELWALRGAAPAGHLPADLEQDLITLKKRVSHLNVHIPLNCIDYFFHRKLAVGIGAEGGGSAFRIDSCFRLCR